MLGNCEKKMVVISSTTNEWPQQNNHIDEKGLMASTGTRVVEKPSLDQQQQQQQPLKCPRCDSLNTKFCYYNNYSLSQPRHFCKACKRYWTRGGTLRNVPVGGGCRKNKRVKRPSSSIDSTTSSAVPAPTINPNVQTQIDLSSSSNHINPLFYGIPTNPSELNLPFSRFNSRVSNVDTVSGYDLQSQMNALGLGFSSGLMASDIHNDYRNGFNPTKQIQDVNSTSLFSSFPFFGSSICSSTSTTTMASLIASSLQQQKYISGGGSKDIGEGNGFHGISSYEDLQMQGRSQGSVVMKDMERGQSRLDWNIPCQNKIEQLNSSDPSSLLWNTTSPAGTWLDQASIGSSVPSLI